MSLHNLLTVSGVGFHSFVPPPSRLSNYLTMFSLVLFLLFIYLFLHIGYDPRVYANISVGNKPSHVVTSFKDFNREVCLYLTEGINCVNPLTIKLLIKFHKPKLIRIYWKFIIYMMLCRDESLKFPGKIVTHKKLRG